MRIPTLPTVLLVLSAPVTTAGQDASDLFATFGAPAAPAFELLPDRPSQVTHAATAADLKASASQLIIGGALGTAAAIDIRPFAFAGGTLREYRQDLAKRILWRSVLSAGTAPAGTGSSDVLLAVGIRVPIIDRGDPRTSLQHTRELLDAVSQQFHIEQPKDPDIISSKWVDENLLKAGAADRVRKRWQQQHWNATRVEVGLAASARVRGGEIEADSLARDRFGLWLAAATGVGSWAELSASGKVALVAPDPDATENGRHLAGTRLRIRPLTWLALAAEASYTWSRHEDAALNDEWSHFAVGAEVPTGFLSDWLGEGWLVIAWGTDVSREGEEAAGMEFRYSVSRNRVVP